MPLVPQTPMLGDSSQPNAGTPPVGQTPALMAAAEMMDTGPMKSARDSLRSAPMSQGQNLQTGFTKRRTGRRGMRVVR